MVKIILSKTASFDLKEFVDYIKRDSIKYAILEKEKIKEAINNLPKQPMLGRMFPSSIITISGNLFSEITGSFMK